MAVDLSNVQLEGVENDLFAVLLARGGVEPAKHRARRAPGRMSGSTPAVPPVPLSSSSSRFASGPSKTMASSRFFFLV